MARDLVRFRFRAACAENPHDRGADSYVFCWKELDPSRRDRHTTAVEARSSYRGVPLAHDADLRR